MTGKLFREPFIHFLIIGAVLFGLYEFTATESSSALESKIEISPEMIKALREQWLKQSGIEPDKETMNELLESLIHDEVMIKEARRLGLDKNDIIIHRRLLQKMDFLLANMSQMQRPNEEALHQYFEINKEKYRVAAKRSFSHIYFSKEKRGERALADAQEVLVELSDGNAPTRAPALGDNFILQYDYKERSQQQVSQTFGLEFAQALFDSNTGLWQGPILSEYGAHLVYIAKATESFIPDLDLIGTQVLDDMMKKQLEELKELNYREIRSRYRINVDHDFD